MNIRKANNNDIESIKKLENKLVENELKYDSRLENDSNKTCTKYINDEDTLILVVEDNDNIIGYLYGYVFGRRGLIKGKCSVLDNIYIEDNYQNKGIGTELINDFKKWSLDKDIDYIEVNVYVNNDNAIKFYSKNNFISKIISMDLNIK